MRVPSQISERIKEAPAQALRGVFAGIGQLLLITDKLRNKAPAEERAPQAGAPGSPERHEAPAAVAAQAPAAQAPAAAEAPAAEAPAAEAPAAEAPAAEQAPAGKNTPEASDFDKTGNVRLLGGDKAGTDTVTEEAAQTAVAGEAAQTPAGGKDADGKDADGKDAGAVDAGMPLPNYDGLSIASLRARLRNLDVAQVRQLAEYEKAHAARDDVLVMYERRIAKLEAGD